MYVEAVNRSAQVNKTCTKCGSGGPFPQDRSRADGLHTQCKECHRSRSEARRKADPGRARRESCENMRLYRERHPERVAASNEKWRIANLAKVRAYVRANSRIWYRENRWRWVVYKFQRRARKAEANGLATVEQIRARIEFFGGVCAYCRGPFECIDHVIALSRGGTNWPANLRPACNDCNLRKHTKTWSHACV